MPDLLAIPDFVSGHKFAGRKSELDELDRWAASKAPLFVIEAIGGAGKSALAWEWTTTRAQSAGTLWYNFCDGGADMAAFVAYALALTTGRQVEEFRGRYVSELAADLLLELNERPYLLVLDGLERVLVACNRLDASQTRDDRLESKSEHCACIKPEDGDLLYRLAAAAPSKVLVTSRLMPAALADAARHPLPGVWHLRLPGLQPDDAMRMMCDLGIRGGIDPENDDSMRRYLGENLDYQPLALGIAAGLIGDYVADTGNFDRWADDPQGGEAAQLATLNPAQRRTHILAAALNALEPNQRQVLNCMAALPAAASFEAIEALSPVEGTDLVSVLQDLERRSLLQRDRRGNRYDLHPVIRGYAFDALSETERRDICNRITDYLRSKPRDRYDNAKTLADLQQSIDIFRALVQANRLDDAASFYHGDFSDALAVSVGAHHEVLALLKPLFPDGFRNSRHGPTRSLDRDYLLNDAGLALDQLGRSGEAEEALAASLRIDIDEGNGLEARTGLSNLGVCYAKTSPARSIAAHELSLELASAVRDQGHIARAHLFLMSAYAGAGLFKQAEAAWEAFRRLTTPVNPEICAVGDAERRLCWLMFLRGTLTNQLLHSAESAAEAGNNRYAMRDLVRLRGEFSLQRGELHEAIASFGNCVQMTQAAGMPAIDVETRLALALARNGDIEKARRIPDGVREFAASVALAELHLELGDREKARQLALAAYPPAWADGPAYPRWLDLTRCRAVFAVLGVPEPKLPAWDPKTAKPVAHEAAVRGLIAKLRKAK